MATAFIGLGSNLGNRLENIVRGLKYLSAFPGIKITGVSGVYETSPMGGPKKQRLFLNAVVRVKTCYTPKELLACLKSIESLIGRKPRMFSRLMDLDILFYNDVVTNNGKLVLPHPRLHLRKFVLRPMTDIAPGFRHPVLGKTIRDLLKSLQDTSQKIRKINKIIWHC